MDGHQYRENIVHGAVVDIVLKKDQPTGMLTRGIVDRILTSKSFHPRGIKVCLQSGQVGRVQRVVHGNVPPEWYESNNDFIVGY